MCVIIVVTDSVFQTLFYALMASFSCHVISEESPPIKMQDVSRGGQICGIPRHPHSSRCSPTLEHAPYLELEKV